MPYDITIENSSSENIQFTVQDSSSTFTPVGSPAVLDVSALESALVHDDVTVTTGSESQGADQGNLTVAAQIDSTGTTNLTLSAIHDLNIDSTITTSGSLTFVSGAAISLDGSTITATGDQTYDGAVFLTASTTLTSPASGFISLDNTLDVGTYNLTLNTAGVASVAGVISGNGSLTQAGTGTLTLTGDNTYSGGTTISAGTLAVGDDSALGTGTLTFADRTTLQAAANGLSLANAMTLAGTDTIDTQANTLTLMGVLSGSGAALTKIGTGTLILIPGNTYSGGTTISGGTLQIGYGETEFTGFGGDITDNAALVFNLGGSLPTFNGDISGTGNLGGSLPTFNGDISGTGTVTVAGPVGSSFSFGGSNHYSGATYVNSGTLYATAISPSDTFSSASAFTIAAGAKLELDGANQTIGSLAGAGTVTSINASAVLTTGADNTSTIFSGTIEDGTGTFFLTKAGTGTLTLTGDNTYSGGTTISAGTLELGNANSASSGRITFGPSANATLKLDSSTMLTNTIYGVTFGDIIDLAGVRYEPGATVSLNTSTNVLTVSVGTSSYQLQLDPTQHFSDGYFQATQDSGTGTQIEEVSCFLPGTLIRTPGGDVAIETMRRGDLVVLTDGRAVAIEWIGRQTVSTQFGDPLRILPIRIKAGALGEDVPRRDLLVSPDHALLVHGVLIQAGALVNGISILREHNVPERFTYYHVELEEHALIFAENTAAETFVDNRDRLAFDNWSEHDALYPDGKPVAELPYPRAKSHRQVPRAIRERLAEHGERIYGRKIREVA